MTENSLMIPESAEVPAYIRNPELARQANEEAAAGISTGFPARVKLAGKQFSLVDGNGDETPFPPAKLVAGPDGNVYLPVIVLRAKKALQKSWYAAAFNPNVEGQGPDCFSNDSERPDPSAIGVQSETCANCPMNAFGSGKDQAGNATKGKACADTKILAVFVPGFGVHSFKIPPASLKNWGLFVKQLSAAGIPLGSVKTLVGFDLTASFPVLVFKFGGYLGEQFIPKLTEMAASAEVEEIVAPLVGLPDPVKTTAPADKAISVHKAIAADKAAEDAFKAAGVKAAADKAAAIAKKAAADKAAAAATNDAKDAAATKASIEASKKAAATLNVADDDMGLGLDLGIETPVVKEVITETVVESAPAASAQEVSDAQLREELGL